MFGCWNRFCLVALSCLTALSLGGCYHYEAPDESGENVVELRKLMVRYNYRQYETVIPLVKRHLKKFPESRQGAQILAFSYLNLGKTEEAEIYLNERIEQWPDWDTGYVGLGRIARGKKLFKSAREYYEKAIEANENSADGYNGLVVVELSVGNFDKAATNADKAMELNDKDANIVANAAIAYSYSGQKEKSENAYKLTKELDYRTPKTLKKILSRELDPFPLKK